jgi:hypothetical protein
VDIDLIPINRDDEVDHSTLEPPYTACPDFYREDPTPKAFGGGVRGAPRQLHLARPSTRLADVALTILSYKNLNPLFENILLQNF